MSLCNSSGQSCYSVFPPKSSLGSAQDTDMLISASGLQEHHVLDEISSQVQSAQSKHVTPCTCRLWSWTESHFMIKNYTMMASPGLIISNMNFNISCIVHKHRFCFLQVWCPTVFASSGHVSQNCCLQDILSCKVLKKCERLCALLYSTHKFCTL